MIEIVYSDTDSTVLIKKCEICRKKFTFTVKHQILSKLLKNEYDCSFCGTKYKFALRLQNYKHNILLF